MSGVDRLVARKKKKRCCRALHYDIIYKPVSLPMSQLETVTLGLDEFEALRLCDYEGKNQQEAAVAMGISRGTVQRLLQSGRKKIVHCLLTSKALVVDQKKEEE